jgi:antitoxin HicB
MNSTKENEMPAEVYAYPASLVRDQDGRFLVRFEDLKGAVTDGATAEEALSEAADALSEALMAAIDAKEDIPSPSPTKRGQVTVAPDPTVALKAALHTAKRRRGVNAADLARKLNIDHKDARRLLDVHHPSKVQSVAKALQAMGLQVVVSVTAAPAFDRSTPVSRADRRASARK